MPSRNATFTKSFVRRPGAPLGDTSIPMRTEAPPPLRQPTRMQRSKTLTRPERGQPQVPLINPQQGVSSKTNEPGSPAWRIFSKLITCWAISPCLSACGMKDKPTQQAWREKVALVFIALLLGGAVGFITMALSKVLCPTNAQVSTQDLVRIGSQDLQGMLAINGWDFNISSAALPSQADVGINLYTAANNMSGYDITPLFNRTAATDYPACNGKTAAYATSTTCDIAAGTAKCPLGYLNTTNLASLKLTNSSKRVGYDWKDLGNATFANYLVLDGHVLNMAPYMAANPNSIANDKVDLAIRSQLATLDQSGGKDATRLFYSSTETKEAITCLTQRYYAGSIDKITPGCFVSDLFLYMSLISILGVVMIRFVMALWFSWFLSWRMSSPPKALPGSRVPHNVLPEGAMTSVNASGAAPWAGKERALGPGGKPKRINHSDAASLTPSLTTLSAEAIGNEPWIICLVTAYSEGEDGISTTLTSLAESEYPDHKKLLFVVADGMVTGSGESQSTPDTCVGLLDPDTRFGTPMPMSFISVAQGSKMHNMAMVYAGHYTRGPGHRVPMVVVVKCGTPEEATEGKPGNRGKRDSQMILMNFLQRVTYNDRMTPLDFDLFRKIHALMGVTPDFFELILMVDADTKVFPAGMRKLSNAMMRDHLIMGSCGETRIANKGASWVTAIQVYEYFISHHMVKSFESVFGGVTCLPGCFSMYRIKARKPSDDDWVPIIVKPEITREYSQSTVQTLHQKNLLLLGEDRFLTTLLLRTFPNRKMVFVPQARCRTEVPHTFKMLLSQRRRWINSTVHNLMELVLVKDLCGTFCFSMQFVVFMDLIGTAVLPVAICLTYILIVSYCLDPPHTFSEAIPLMLLIAVIGLPAVLILLATRKVVYVMWMGVYLVFLPVWNFILPVYAFWHFDDFSWGETRKVEGEGKGGGHGDEGGVFAAASVPLRRWEDWERSRLRKAKREEKRRREMEQQFGGQFWNDQQGQQRGPHQDVHGNLTPSSNGFPGPAAGGPPRTLGSRDSDTWSDSSQEDVWGAQIGTYEERGEPPPTQIFRHTVVVDDDQILGAEDLEAMLEKEGFEAGHEGAMGMRPRNGSAGIGGANGVPRQRPLAPSTAQARRSQRFSRLPPNPQVPSRWSTVGGEDSSSPVPSPGPGRHSPAGGGPGAGPGGYHPVYGNGGYAHTNASLDPLSFPPRDSGEDVALMRSASPATPAGGFQLQDFGPAGATATAVQQGGGGAGGSQQSHARQRSGGAGTGGGGGAGWDGRRI